LNPQQFNDITYVLGHLLPRFLNSPVITFAGIYTMAQQADMQKRLKYMNQVVQNSSLNAQCILGNNKRELQDNIVFLQTKIIHHLSVPKGRGRGISDLAAVMHHQVKWLRPTSQCARKA
jgi:hypothetical protein